MFAQSVMEDLHNCLKCAACQAVCPTYKSTRMERHAPRGRIQMVKKYLEGDLTVSRGLQEALMSCILCESCTQACPSGVRLDRVFENMRMELHEALGAKLPKKALFAALSNPVLLRLGARIGRAGQRAFIAPLNIKWKLGEIPLNRLPSFNQRSFRQRMGEVVPAAGKRRGRVLYFTGCATDLINEDVGDAVVKVLTRLGLEVVIPHDQVCCSVPIFLSGARREAIPNIEKNLSILDRDDVDAIVVDCATCGGGLKKSIPHLTEDLGLDSEKARRVAAKVRDVSEIIAERLEDVEWKTRKSRPRVIVTYHDPCHLVRSMGVSRQPRMLLEALEGVRLVEMVGADQCCGGAGSFQFEHVEISASVTGRKKENIRSTGAAVAATGCPGCRLTLAGNLCRENDPLVVHTIQLLAERVH
ncbi:MAG: (Fe-S)-binding protein [Desulfomonilaceae bacterium]|nr:(Fe-S)-binding protein [Desulfomonilaceae bacterium]